jgi:hypothetical protein
VRIIVATLAIALAPAALYAQAADTASVPVRGATVVACFEPLTRKEAEFPSDATEALDDWEWYWSTESDALKGHGVAAETRMTRWVKLAYPGRLRLVRCPGAGYVLAAPGRLPKVIIGVATDDDLLAQAAAYFGRPELKHAEAADAGHR